MEEEKKPVEATAVAGSAEGVEDKPAVAPKQDVDYAQLLAVEQAKSAKLAEEAENYKRGMLKAKGKTVDEQESEEKTVGDLVKEEIQKGMAPILQSMTRNTLETALNSVSSNPDEQKLIQFIYDNQIIHSGNDAESIKRDLENAQAIANKQKLKVASSEIKLAKQNMTQMPNQSGSSSEGQEVKDNFASPEMIQSIRLRGLALKNSTMPNMDVEAFVKKAVENLKKI
jgi:hypothetical protein